MDSEVAKWWEMANEAARLHPEKEEAIYAKLDDLIFKRASEYQTMAQQAIDEKGADPQKVSEKLNSLFSGIGFRTSKPIELFKSGEMPIKQDLGQRKVDYAEFPQDRSLTYKTDTSNVYDPNYGETEEEFYNRKERESKEPKATSAERKGAQADLGDAFKYGAEQGAARVLKGLGLDTNLEAPVYPEEDVGKKIANMGGAASLGVAAMANPYTAAGFGLTQGSAGMQESLQAGASGPQAAAAGAIEAATYPLLRALPASLRGSLPARIASGIGIGEATGLASDAALNAVNPESLNRDLLDPYARGADALFGAVGGASHSRRVEESPPPSNPIADAFEAGKESISPTKSKETTPVQPDLFSSQPELSLDMFSKESVPADLIESRRKIQEQANNREAPQRTTAEETDLERNYLLDQQEKLDRANTEGIVSRRGDIPEPYLNIPKAVRQEGFFDPNYTGTLIGESPNKRTVFTREGEPVGYKDAPTNDAMARQMMLAMAERGKLRNEPTPVEPRGPETFNPSKNEIVPQEASQGQLRLEQQADLFGNAQEPAQGFKPQTLTEKIRAKEAETLTPEQIRAKLAAKSLDLYGQQDGYGKRGVPTGIQKDLNEGKLTVGRAVDAVINDEGLVLRDVPEAKEWAKVLKTVGEKFGGLDNPIMRPEHAGAEAKQAEAALALGSQGGVWRSSENRAYVGDNANILTMLHESGHAIWARALEMGERSLKALDEGKIPELDGPSVAAFKTLRKSMEIADVESKRLADAYREKLIQSGKTPEEADFQVKRTMRYGFENIHEMLSELHSNPAFREHLKSIKMTPELAKGVGLGRLALAKVKNLYEAVITKAKEFLGIDAKKLGVSPKMMDTALDAMFSGSQDYAASLSKKNVEGIQAGNRAKLGDRAFPEGEPVEHIEMSSTDLGALAPGENPKKQEPRGKVVTALKAGFGGRGVNAIVTRAAEKLSGLKQEARAVKAAQTNQMYSGMSKLTGVSRTRAENAIATIFKDTGAPEARVASAELKGISPELSRLATELSKDNWYGATNLVDELLKSQAGKELPDAKVLAFANKIADNIGKWSYRGYSGKEGQKLKYETAYKAREKEAKGKMLSDEEQKALSDLHNLEGYIESNVLGDAPALERLGADHLRDLYTDAFGNTEALKGLNSKAAKALMVEKLARFNAGLENRPGVIKQLVKEISGMSEETGKAAKYYSNLKYGKDTLKAREEVPEPIRKWWGEISDPLIKQINSRLVQQLQLAEVKVLNELREEGLAAGIFSTQKGLGHEVPLTGKSSGALEGLYTTPDVASVIDSVTEFSTKPKDWYEALVHKQQSSEGVASIIYLGLKAASSTIRATKTATTVGNIGAWYRNAIGSPMQLWSNGNLNPASYGKGWDVVGELVGLSNKKELSAEARRMIRLGLAEATQTHETYSPRTRRKMDKLLKLMGESPEKADSWLRSLKETGGASVDVLKELYGAMDLWTKHANFYNEHGFWEAYNKRHGIEMSPEKLDDWVADRIKQTNITYSRSPYVLKMLESVGLTRFANYYSETFRTTANNVGVGFADVARGLKEGDAQLVAHGTKRVVGTMAAVGAASSLYTAAIKAGAAALGFATAEAGDDVQEYMKEDSFLDPDSTVLIQDKKSGSKYGFDTAMVSPYDPVYSVGKELVLAAANPKDAEKHLVKAKEKAFDLMSRNSIIVNAVRAYQGREPSLAKQAPELYAKLLNEGVNTGGLTPEQTDQLINLGQPLVPKATTEAYRGAEANADTRTKTAIRTGIGVYEVSPEKDIKNYLARSFNREVKDVKSSIATMMRKPVDISSARMEKDFVKGMEQLSKPYEKLQKAFKAALAEGSDREALLDAIDAKTSSDIADMLDEGTLSPAELIFADMEEEANKAIDEAPEEQKDAVENRWNKKLDMLEEILSKYEGKTLEEIKGAQNG